MANVCFGFLDSRVVAGKADELVFGTWTFARLLEEVAALAGVLRHCGVAKGTMVPVCLEAPDDAIVAALAIARIGGLVTTRASTSGPIGLGSAATGTERRLVRDSDQDPQNPSSTELDWAVMLRAGKTDPASAEVVEGDHRYCDQMTTDQATEVLVAMSLPAEPAHLAEALRVGPFLPGVGQGSGHEPELGHDPELAQ